jgi:non-ribosomal peptide synthetase component F
MTTLAGYVAALALETGQEDVCVFSPYAHRDRPETAPLFGYLANPILLRTRLSGNPTLRELLSRVKDTVLDAYAHPHFPVLELRPEMYRVSFNYLPRFDLPRLPGLQVEGTPIIPADTTRFELIFFAAEQSNGLGASVLHDADLLEPALVQRLLARYSKLLELLAEEPALKLDAAFEAARRLA